MLKYEFNRLGIYYYSGYFSNSFCSGGDSFSNTYVDWNKKIRGRIWKGYKSELDGVNKVSGVASMRRKLSSLVIGGGGFHFSFMLS
jgi:hypothetical protein